MNSVVCFALYDLMADRLQPLATMLCVEWCDGGGAKRCHT